MRKWLALRKNNLGASKETLSLSLSLMHNSKLGHYKSWEVCWCVYVCSWSDYLTKKQSVQHSNQGGSQQVKEHFGEITENEDKDVVRGWLEEVGDVQAREQNFSLVWWKHTVGLSVCGVFICNLKDRYSHNKSTGRGSSGLTSLVICISQGEKKKNNSQLTLENNVSMSICDVYVLCVYNQLTGLSRYTRLLPCMTNRGSRVMDKAWWSVSTDAMIWSNLPARPPRVTMASTWKYKYSLIRHRKYHSFHDIVVYYSCKMRLKWQEKNLFTRSR